jgi:hypothetical protein
MGIKLQAALCSMDFDRLFDDYLMSVMGLVKIHQDSCFFQGLASSPQTVAFSLLFEGSGLSAVWKSAANDNCGQAMTITHLQME